MIPCFQGAINNISIVGKRIGTVRESDGRYKMTDMKAFENREATRESHPRLYELMDRDLPGSQFFTDIPCDGDVKIITILTTSKEVHLSLGKLKREARGRLAEILLEGWIPIALELGHRVVLFARVSLVGEHQIFMASPGESTPRKEGGA